MFQPLIDPRIQFPIWCWPHRRPEKARAYESLEELAIEYEYMHAGTAADYGIEAPIVCDSSGRLVVVSIDAQDVSGALLVRDVPDPDFLSLIEAAERGELEALARQHRSKWWRFSNL
jgi:hypothetical protein